VNFVNSLLRGLFDVLLLPFRGLPAIVGLVVISAVTAVIMLLIFKRTSNQEKIAAVKRCIHAGLFEIRLFNDDLRAILRAQREILWHNLRYMGLSLVPMLWMIIPLVLVIAQLQFQYGYAGLEPGDTSLLKIQLKDDWDRSSAMAGGGSRLKPAVSLEVPAGLRVETPPVWIPSQRELAWRIAAEEWGEYELTLKVGDEAYTKSASVAEGLALRSPLRMSPGLVNQILYPAEDALPAESPFESIELIYPGGDVDVLGWQIHWMIVFFVLSIAFAFAMRNWFGVTI
jgi:hypothetical protein